MRNIVAILLTVFCCTIAAAQQPFTRDYWLNEAGAAVKVNAIEHDANGYLWLGADDGLYRFNGRNVVAIPDTQHKAVTSIATHGNEVYIGYKDGSLAKIIDDKIVPYVIRGSRPTMSISDMYADERGTLWVCTEGQGFFAVFNGMSVACNSTHGLSDNFLYNICMLPGMAALVSTDQGINQVMLHNGKLAVKVITTSDGLPDNIVRVIQPASGGYYWVGTQSGGVAVYDTRTGRAWVPFSDSDWHWGQVNDILPLQNGKAWVATDDGYLLQITTRDYKNMQVRVFAFPDRKMYKLSISRSGVLWCATNSGLTMITDEYLKYLPVSYPYKLDQVNAMTCTADGTIWFSLDNKLYTIPLHGTLQAPVLRYIAAASIKSLHASEGNIVWIGTLGKGLLRMDNDGSTVQVTSVPQLLNETVLDISGRGNSLWVSGLNGVVEMLIEDGVTQPELVKLYNKRSGTGSDYVYQVYHDSKGRVWFATDGGGVTMYYKGTFKKYTGADGLPGKVIYTLAEDAYGNIWASVPDEGIYWFDGKRWRKLQQQFGVNDVNIATLAANATGQMAVVHKKGIDIWYPDSKQFMNFGKRQGLHIDSVSEVLKLYARDAGGNVYIPFEQGFVVIKNTDAVYDIRPDIRIQSLSVFFKPESLQAHDFAYSQNQISFKFEGINYTNPDKLYYRYKLDGFSNTWVVTNDESVTFPQLPPGKYTFRVQVSVNTAFLDAKEDTYKFSIALPVWRERWFIILAALLVIGLIYLIITRREKNLRKLSLLQRERMMFEYEHLKSQVNPHFLFNSLNTLVSLIEEDQNAATQYAAQLSDLYRNSLAYRNEDLITLEKEWEILENYIYIQKTRFGDALVVETDVSENLMQTKKIIPLALQLIVENAIKHNVVSKSMPLHISIIATHDSITIRNSLNPKISKEKGAGLGMLNIKKRYSLLSQKSIYYGISDKEYVVNLPLL